MKPLFCCLFLLWTVAAYAQEDSSAKAVRPPKPREFKQELRLGAGGYTLPFLAEQFFAEQKKDQLFLAETPKSKGVFTFGFSGRINESWNVGITLALEQLSGSISRNVYDSVASDTVLAKTDYQVKAITVMPYVTKYWKQSKMLNLYSGFGLGFSFRSANQTGNLNIGRTEDTEMGISLQLTAVGVRVGNKYAGFAELGFGNLGLLHLGFSAGF